MPRFFALILCSLLCLSAHEVTGQNLQTKANEIRAAMDARDFDRAESLVREFRAANQEAFLAAVEAFNVTATLRREKGHDIDAACGQLRLKTERELAQVQAGS